jgi:flavin-dependent dehydrogenase
VRAIAVLKYGAVTTRYDVLIAGGGLAGLTLARQLKQEQPELTVFLAEKRKHPVPEAAFKVGESSVEAGAYYFSKVLGLESHLRGDHLEKLGIRYFFPYGDNRDFARRVEFGPAMFPKVPSFQLDRGRLENYLLRTDRELGVHVVDGAAVRNVELSPGGHTLTVQAGERTFDVTGRWLVDASGRSGLIRRKLNLTRPVKHLANASWWRFSKWIKVDDWSDDPAWKTRVPSRLRWLSTNHLMGRGYWVWLIPLGSGSISLGIVTDATLHPYERINRMERAMDWLREFEPQCAEICEAHMDGLEDFLALKHYAHGCERVYSPDRWLLTGEAGVFTDPFYSPGSDFIGMSNDNIAEIIVRDHRGQDVGSCIETLNSNYLRLFEAFIRVYEGQYRLMGNAQVMTLKAAWDNACYWAIPAKLFFQRRTRDAEFMASIEPLMRRFVVLHARMQSLLRAWDLADDSLYADAWVSVLNVDFLKRMQADLGEARIDIETLRSRLEENFRTLERFAGAIQALAARTSPELGRHVSAPPARELPDISHLTLTPIAPDLKVGPTPAPAAPQA